MGYIPQDVIDQILDRCDIVEVIASYVPLKPAGRNFKALSPFQHEKTPSFFVNPQKQIFHCFSSGVGGNVITFVMKVEHCTFPEACRLLAERYGIVIPAANPAEAQRGELRQQIRQVTAQAAEYFHQVLLTDKNPTTSSARDYLKGRGLTLENVRTFLLGFAPDRWDGLITFLKNKGCTCDLMEKAGLALPQTRGDGYYDRFRNRVMFPIFDVNNRCIAFGARAMEKDNPAKYINSPETMVYTKGQHLYGLHLSKEAIVRQDYAVVVEGYMDFITPFAAGVKNLVASLGTALTVEQIRLVRRYTEHVVMLFDADQAGEAAMMRSFDTLIAEGMHVRVAVLEPGEDPDSFVRKHGAEQFRQRIENSRSLLEYKLDMLKRRFDTATIEGRAAISQAMLPTISKINNAIVQTEWIKFVAQSLKLSQEALTVELNKVEGAAGDLSRRANAAPVKSGPPQAIRPVERDLLKLMLEDREFIQLTRLEVGPEDFQDRSLRDIVKKIYELFERGQIVTAAALISCFEEEEAVQTIALTVAGEQDLPGDKHKIHRDCLNRIRQDRLRVHRRILLDQMEEARRLGNDKRLDELTQQFNQLIKR